MFCHKFSPKKLDDILYNKVLKENFKKLSLKKTVLTFAVTIVDIKIIKPNNIFSILFFEFKRDI